MLDYDESHYIAEVIKRYPVLEEHDSIGSTITWVDPAVFRDVRRGPHVETEYRSYHLNIVWDEYIKVELYAGYTWINHFDDDDVQPVIDYRRGPLWWCTHTSVCKSERASIERWAVEAARVCLDNP